MKKQALNQSWPVFSEEEVQIVSNILRSGKVNYWTGDQGKLFEKEFAEYIGVNHAIALANGTLALELALKALGITPCDEVIVPSRTYIATASAVVIAGAKPVIADVDRVSGNISVETIDLVRTDNTKAIIVVHLAGWPCDMGPIMKYAKQHNLLVIEDCAQAHGANYKGQKVGSFGHAAAFSFCQDKIMTTCGEGGMVVFQDKDAWSRAWSYKDHGKSYDAVYGEVHPPGVRWLVDSFGSNYRMTEIQAGVGRFQLNKLDEWLGIRQRNAAILDLCFNELPLLRQVKPPDNIMHARYKYYTYINPLNLKKGYSRDRIMEDFDAYGISCSHGSCSEIYLERAFKSASFGPNNRLTSAKELGETSLIFLVDPTLSIADMEYICDVSRKVFMNATS